MIFIERKTDIAAPAVVTDIQPDKIVTCLVAQAAMDGAKVGEILWEKTDRKECFADEEWTAFVAQTEASCKEYGYSEEDMTSQIVKDKYRVFLHAKHRNQVDRKLWADYFSTGIDPMHRVMKDMAVYCMVGLIPV